jgi:hypothetical protein
MKNDKTTKPESKDKKNIPTSNPVKNGNKKGKNGIANIGSIITSAVEKTKPRTGRGLADEGTIVSYDEER